jgi:transposase
MLAVHPRVVDIIWQAIESRLPEIIDEHPLGCHRPRRDNRGCFEALLFRLVTGCSWDVAGRLGKGSETTLRRRRTEWWQAGVFDGLVDETLAGYDRLIGFDLSEVSIDGSQHKAPFGGEGTGPKPH